METKFKLVKEDELPDPQYYTLLTEDFVNTLNNELRELIEEAFQPVEVYDFIYENGQFNYR